MPRRDSPDNLSSNLQRNRQLLVHIHSLFTDKTLRTFLFLRLVTKSSPNSKCQQKNSETKLFQKYWIGRNFVSFRNKWVQVKRTFIRFVIIINTGMEFFSGKIYTNLSPMWLPSCLSFNCSIHLPLKYIHLF